MKISELLTEAKYDYSLADYQATPYDPGFEWQEAGRNKEEPHIGPQEGKYLNLMLRGIKPAAIISTPAEKKLFEPYIKDGTVKVAAKDNYLTIVTLPNETWRGPKLLKLFQKAQSVNGNLTKEDDARIGLLLGLPKDSIKYYLKTRH